jgi:hypothetical protein
MVSKPTTFARRLVADALSRAVDAGRLRTTRLKRRRAGRRRLVR